MTARKKPKGTVSLLEKIQCHRAEDQLLSRQSFELHAGLRRAMDRVTTKYLRPLGLVAVIIDWQAARWLKEILRDLPATRSDGTPWDPEVVAFARAFANEAKKEQDRHPIRWREPAPADASKSRRAK